jgi:hypothetical protein
VLPQMASARLGHIALGCSSTTDSIFHSVVRCVHVPFTRATPLRVASYHSPVLHPPAKASAYPDPCKPRVAGGLFDASSSRSVHRAASANATGPEEHAVDQSKIDLSSRDLRYHRAWPIGTPTR